MIHIVFLSITTYYRALEHVLTTTARKKFGNVFAVPIVQCARVQHLISTPRKKFVTSVIASQVMVKLNV